MLAMQGRRLQPCQTTHTRTLWQHEAGFCPLALSDGHTYTRQVDKKTNSAIVGRVRTYRIQEARMCATWTDGSDEENTDFGLPEQVADQQPGFAYEVPTQEAETGDDRQFRPSEEQDVPQQSLAERLGPNQTRG